MTYNGLRWVDRKEAKTRAKEQIRLERSGIQNGLKCRWSVLNKAMMKYWRFKQFNFIAGGSGSGKSMLLNMLENDFTDTRELKMKADYPPHILDKLEAYSRFELQDGYLYRSPINGDLPFKPVCLKFGYEMPAEAETIRMTSTEVGMSYGYILSSEALERVDEEYIFNVISEDEEKLLFEVMDALDYKNIFHFETRGNLSQMIATVAEFYRRYPPPEYRLIITLDHTLLSKKQDEDSDNALQNETAKIAIELRNAYDALIIFLGQFNNEIERPNRRVDKNLHFPTKMDIYSGGQIYQASDSVITFHRPRLLGIAKYGIGEIDTQDLIHCGMLKGRNMGVGQMWFKADFAHGQINPFRPKKKAVKGKK